MRPANRSARFSFEADEGHLCTRRFCVAFSLGVNDTALRIVVRFADEGQLHGQSVLSLPLHVIGWPMAICLSGWWSVWPWWLHAACIC
jgi:hypothetical protein